MNNGLYELIEKAQKGDKTAFERLCESKGRAILYLAMQNVGNLHDAEDITQEIFVKMYKNLNQLRSPAAFNVWLNRMVINECNMRYRKNAKTSDSVSIENEEIQIPEDHEEFLPQDFVESQEKQQALVRVVTNLPESYRNVVNLFYFESLSYVEIAKILDINTKTVDNRLVQAKKAIKKDLEKIMGGSMGNAEGLGAFAAAPVLTQVLQKHAAELFPDKYVHGLVEANPVFTVTTAPKLASFGKTRLIKIAIVPAVAAGLIIGIVSLQSNTDGGSPILGPDSPSISVFHVVPQLREAGMDGELDIFTDSKNVQSQAPQGVLQATPVSGVIYLKDGEGKVLRPLGGLNGKTVVLKDHTGKEIASTTVDAAGAFQFAPQQLAVPTQLEVLLVTGNDVFTPAADNMDGRTIISLTPGEALDIKLYVQKTKTPDATLVLLDGDCDCGHINPTSVSVQSDDILPVTQRWDVVRKSDGQTVATGTTDVIKPDISAWEEGVYIVTCTVTDEVGNSRILKVEFVIVSGNILPGQFT